MTDLELKQWLTVTENSRYRWMEDDITRLNGQGLLFYFGGENGVHIRILPDGKLIAGPYEGALPYIGEACFTMELFEDCGGFDRALEKAAELGGPKFLQALFPGRSPQGWNGPDGFSGMNIIGEASI